MPKKPYKPKLLWLQSITCNGNTHSFLNHPDLFSILS
ncbi:MAG: hydrogenase, partial [Sulfurovum sp.]